MGSKGGSPKLEAPKVSRSIASRRKGEEDISCSKSSSSMSVTVSRDGRDELERVGNTIGEGARDAGTETGVSADIRISERRMQESKEHTIAFIDTESYCPCW